MSQGKLQFDLWNVAESALSGRFDWQALRARIAVAGIRNSLLTAPMPTASTSQVGFLLFTVTFYANHAHNLTRSP